MPATGCVCTRHDAAMHRLPITTNPADTALLGHRRRSHTAAITTHALATAIAMARGTDPTGPAGLNNMATLTAPRPNRVTASTRHVTACSPRDASSDVSQ